MNIDEIKFRCHALGLIMPDSSKITELQLKKIEELENRTKPRTPNQEAEYQRLILKRDSPPELSETAKAHCLEKFIELRYGRVKSIENKYLIKGLAVEKESFKLFSRGTGMIHLQYEKDRLENEYISGLPDCLDHGIVTDIKSSWDIFTFFNTVMKGYDSRYFWQVQGYMFLTGLPKARLAFCLVNTPDELINDEKRRIQWKMNSIDTESEEYKAACLEIEKRCIYDDIPINERIYTFDIERDELAIEKIKTRVKECREYIKVLNNSF